MHLREDALNAGIDEMGRSLRLSRQGNLYRERDRDGADQYGYCINGRTLVLPDIHPCEPVRHYPEVLLKRNQVFI